MTINQVFESATRLQVGLTLENENLVLDGPVAAVDQLLLLARPHKPELIKILNGETIIDVGQCDCGSSLLGLPTRDGYVNRVCPDCGQWFRCLDPYHDWTDQELTELLGERIAIIQHNGQTNQDEAEKIAHQWLELVIGKKRFNRIAPNAQSASELMSDNVGNSDSQIFNVAPTPTNDINKWLPDALTSDSLSTQLLRS